MQYDVAIAGGGPAGAAASITLARQGWRVLLAHDPPADRDLIGEGLPPIARPLLGELGVLDQVLADGHRPSHGTVSAWGSNDLHANDFLFTLHGDGLLLDRLKFDATLRQAARVAGVDVHEGARLVLDRPGSTPTAPPLVPGLRLRHHGAECVVASRMVIDAGGRAPVLSRRFGAVRQSSDRLLAFFVYLATQDEGDHWSSLLVEAVTDGWWYSALLPSRRRLVVFLSDADLVDRPRVLDRSGFWAALQRTQSLRALIERHRYGPVTDPQATTASSARLDRAAGSGWLAVGDAAQSFDPLSSKGIVNALYTGVHGAHAVAAALRGDAGALAHYDAHLSEIFRAYLQHLADAYRLERRWPAAPFWRRRHGHATDGLPAGPAAISSLANE